MSFGLLKLGAVIFGTAMVMVYMMVFPLKDKSSDGKFNKHDIYKAGICEGILNLLLVSVYSSAIEVVVITLLCSSLVFLSYTDIKTGEVYAAPIVAGIAILTFLVPAVTGKSVSFWVVPIMGVLVIAALANSLGWGDVLIYLMLGIGFTAIKDLPVTGLILNILVSMALSIPLGLVALAKNHWKKIHKPFTVYIAIAFVIGGILKV